MLLGKVVGCVWATKKNTTLKGLRLLMVQPFSLTGRHTIPPLVAADPLVGAGIGETVIVAYGKPARDAIDRGDRITCQLAVVGIVDKIELGGGRVFLP
jgi:ethanolamine utilization protein EutN